jgi:hypothetical protein
MSGFNALRAMSEIRKGIWLCKDGRSIPIQDMEISHLKNAVQMLKRSFIKKHAEELAACISESEVELIMARFTTDCKRVIPLVDELIRRDEWPLNQRRWKYEKNRW